MRMLTEKHGTNYFVHNICNWDLNMNNRIVARMNCYVPTHELVNEF